MKNAGFKYLLAIVLSAVLVQACAKKDSSLRARQAQTADEKAKAEAAAAEKAAAKAAGKAVPGSGDQEPATSASTSCVSKTTFDKAGENEEEIKLEDIVTKEKGTLVLTESVTNIAMVDKANKAIGEFELTASRYETPEKFEKEIEDAKKALFTCNRLDLPKDVLHKISSLAVPNAINTEDGKVLAKRTEIMSLITTTLSNLSIVKPVNENIKDSFTVLAKGTEVKMQVLRNKDHGITIKVQYKMVDQAGIKMTKSMRATYAFKAAAETVPATESVPATDVVAATAENSRTKK